MERPEDHVSKRLIIYWLDNYEYIAAGDRPPEAPVSNGGPKAYDGVTANQLNKLMLDQAINNLPTKLRALIRSRYVHRHFRKKTLFLLGISPPTYYVWTDKAVDLIYKEINGV